MNRNNTETTLDRSVVRNIKCYTALFNCFHVPYTVSQKKLTLETRHVPRATSRESTPSFVLKRDAYLRHLIGCIRVSYNRTRGWDTNLFSSHRMSVTYSSRTIIQVRINIFNKNGVYYCTKHERIYLTT